MATTSCTTFSVASYCPGSAIILCCVQESCTAGGASGTCKSTSQPCSGTYCSGVCPGPSTIQCCVASSSGSNLKALDTPSRCLPLSGPGWLQPTRMSSFRAIPSLWRRRCGTRILLRRTALPKLRALGRSMLACSLVSSHFLARRLS